MAGALLDTWSITVAKNRKSIVIPDGCRDLIIKTVNNQLISCHISPLFDQAKVIHSRIGDHLQGFRLKPGARVNEVALLSSLNKRWQDEKIVLERLDYFTYRSEQITEALECFTSGVNTVNHAAKRLGVSSRTLQRLIVKETQRTPNYWIRLAKIRCAAREIFDKPYVKIANDYGYYDQAHLCREIKHWFGMPISELKQSQDFAQQINDIAYA